MNLYEWEAATTAKLKKYGDPTITGLLLLSAVVIVAIALVSRSTLFKTLTLAYVVLP